jgi:hypothetical protein
VVLFLAGVVLLVRVALWTPYMLSSQTSPPTKSLELASHCESYHHVPGNFVLAFFSSQKLSATSVVCFSFEEIIHVLGYKSLKRENSTFNQSFASFYKMCCKMYIRDTIPYHTLTMWCVRKNGLLCSRV